MFLQTLETCHFTAQKKTVFIVNMKIANILAMLLTQSSNEFVCLHVLGNPTIVFSGTQTWRDLLYDDFDIHPVLWPDKDGHYVHGGFARRTCRLSASMKSFVDDNDEFVLAGHSMGGCCAILMASHLHHIGKQVHQVYTFGTPQLATRKFATLYEKQGLLKKTVNYATPRDPIVHRLPYLYERVGEVETIPFSHDDIWMHHEMDSYSSALIELERNRTRVS